MEKDKEEVSTTSLLRDMNGNTLRHGDLVMVLLEKPALVGFITKINTPSILDPRDKNAPGVMTVTGTISIPFDPKRINLLQQTAKLVDPRAENLVNAIADSVRKGRLDPERPLGVATLHKDINAPANESGAEGQKPSGPTIVPPSAPVVDDPSAS